MFGSGSLIAGKIAYAVACAGAAVVLVVSGYAHQVVGLTKSLGGGVSIGNSSSVGAMNVLLMGLESRTDFHGNILSGGLLAAMHAGSVAGVENGTGGQATNTLILIHIFAGGQKAVGFSIPRDDYVTYPEAYDGQSAGKIDQAYGLAYAQSLNATVNDTSLSHDQRYDQANQAGQAADAEVASPQAAAGIDGIAIAAGGEAERMGDAVHGQQPRRDPGAARPAVMQGRKMRRIQQPRPQCDRCTARVVHLEAGNRHVQADVATAG